MQQHVYALTYLIFTDVALAGPLQLNLGRLNLEVVTAEISGGHLHVPLRFLIQLLCLRDDLLKLNWVEGVLFEL